MITSNKVNPTQLVYDFIISKIKSKEWIVGTKIMTEKSLCTELGVSRVSVSEAIDKLAVLGLLNRKQGSGTYVSSIGMSTYMNGLQPMILIDEYDLLSILEFRVYFEYGNIKLFMDHHDVEDIRKLEYYYEKMKDNINNHEEFHYADFKFHEVIANGTKNVIVIKIYEILFEILKVHQGILHNKIGPNVGIEYHQMIINAIKANDSKLAALLMRRHIEETIRKYKGEE